MSSFVFLGPSLPRERATPLLDAVYLPPVAMGDVYRLTESGARAGDRIAIIDGLFEQVPAVWHKEILHALSRGIHVYGASSMGALRAAELHPFGMIGVGRVFEAYRDGAIEDDDEVAVAHAPASDGFRSLSAAMIGIRFALAELVQEGAIDSALGDRLTAAAKAQPYLQRNWGDLIAIARKEGASEAACAALRARARAPDVKAMDAETLLRRVAADEASGHKGAPRPDFVFHHTSFWAGLVARFEGTNAQGAASAEAERVALCFRAAGPARDQVIGEALLDRLILASTRGYTPGPDELAQAQRRLAAELRRQHGRVDTDWRRRQGVDDRLLAAAIELEARRGWLIERLIGELDGHVLRRLKLTGRYADFARDVAAALGEVAGEAAAKPSWRDLGIDHAALERWYIDRFGPMTPQPHGHARALGFTSLREFIDHVVPVYLADQADVTEPMPRAVAGQGQ